MNAYSYTFYTKDLCLALLLAPIVSAVRVGAVEMVEYFGFFGDI